MTAELRLGERTLAGSESGASDLPAAIDASQRRFISR